MTRTTATAAATALIAFALLAGCGRPAATGEDPPPLGPAGIGSAPGVTPTPGPSNSGTSNEPAGDPAGEPGNDPGGDPAGTGELEQVLLLPVDLVAPVGCFTAGLVERFVDGRGTQTIDARPYGELHTLPVEYDPLTRLRMDSTERRVHLLPGSARAVAAPAGSWSVQVDVHMFLSGGFVIDYTATHHGEPGAFRERFTSPVDDTCTVEIVYGITTPAVP